MSSTKSFGNLGYRRTAGFSCDDCYLGADARVSSRPAPGSKHGFSDIVPLTGIIDDFVQVPISVDGTKLSEN